MNCSRKYFMKNFRERMDPFLKIMANFITFYGLNCATVINNLAFDCQLLYYKEAQLNC